MKNRQESGSTKASTTLPRLDREQATMQAAITDALRRQIIDGTLAPGTRIGEEWISKEMGVSRGPVREAIRVLENEGLLIVHAFKGARVNAISTDELRSVLIPVRFILEREACLRALSTMTDSDLVELDNLVERMREVGSSASVDQLMQLVDLDALFHERLTALGGQYHTLQIWRAIQPRIRAGFFRLASAHSDLREIADEHGELLDALRTREPETVTNALEDHICTTQIALIDRAENDMRNVARA